MSYTYTAVVPLSWKDAVEKTRAALATQGFGILSEIDVRATFAGKLGEDAAEALGDYVILGACNPKMALEAIGMEPRVGAMLPCNVILREVPGGVEVSAIDPVASMQAIDNAALHSVAGRVRDLLAKAVADI